MQHPPKDVFIILLNWNGWEDTIECLESLRKVTYSRFKTVVVDNGSTDDSIEKISEWLNKQDSLFLEMNTDEMLFTSTEQEVNSTVNFFLIKNSDNLGFAGGNNIGISFAEKKSADLVLLLNNDTTVEPDFLSKLIGIYDNGKHIALTPQIRYFDYPDTIWNCGGKLLWFGSKKYFFQQKNKAVLPKKEVLDVTFVTGCALLYDYKKIGYLSKDFFFGEEDYEFSLRVKKQGYKVGCVIDSVIYHKVSKSINVSSNTFGKVYIHYLNRFIDTKKYFSYPKWKFIKVLNLLYILPMVKVRHRFNNRQIISLARLLWQQSIKLNAVSKETFLNGIKRQV
jgi:GT2 family glycosyltransferase